MSRKYIKFFVLGIGCLLLTVYWLTDIPFINILGYIGLIAGLALMRA